jgi:hypothetical protein
MELCWREETGSYYAHRIQNDIRESMARKGEIYWKTCTLYGKFYMEPILLNCSAFYGQTTRLYVGNNVRILKSIIPSNALFGV